METDANLSQVGALLADRTRARILMTLLGGGRSSASTLAVRAGVSRALVSHHLRRLVDGRLIVAETHGRRRDYRLADGRIADALEALIPLAPAGEVRSLRAARERDRLRHGRLCYDHLAGAVAVALVDGLVASGWLSREGGDFGVPREGVSGFARLGLDVRSLATQPRPLARGCNDWSEGREHLAGSLGAALSAELLRRDWVRAGEGTRAITVTELGIRELHDRLGIEVASHAQAARLAA